MKAEKIKTIAAVWVTSPVVLTSIDNWMSLF